MKPTEKPSINKQPKGKDSYSIQALAQAWTEFGQQRRVPISYLVAAQRAAKTKNA